MFILYRKQSNSKALELVESLLVLPNTGIISVGLSGLVPFMQGHGILLSPIGRIITLTRWSQVVRYIHSVCATLYMMFSRQRNWEIEKKKRINTIAICKIAIFELGNNNNNNNNATNLDLLASNIST